MCHVIIGGCVQFDREAEGSGSEQSVSDKAVLLFNQALIHRRVRRALHPYIPIAQVSFPTV